MARRCTFGLVLLLVAGCASPEKPAEGTAPPNDLAGAGGTGGTGGAGGAGGVGGTGGTGGGADFSSTPSDLAMMSCTDGGTCMTSNPGACTPGHVVCSGGSPTCVSDVSSQSCYSGPANTAGVGICKAGTQLCVGALGACNGEVKPAAIENCFNDLDDDCDGVVNNGCPDHLTTGTARVLTREGGPGGTLSSLRCPANSVVTRTVMHWDDSDVWVAGVDIYCSTMTLTRGTSSYSVTLAQSANAAASAVGGNAGGNPPTQDIPCDTTAFNVGNWIDGKATPNAGTGNYVSGFGMACEAGTAALDAMNKLSVTFAHANAGTYYYYTSRTDPFFESDCNSNEALVGYDVRTGAWMDAISAVCAPIVTVYK